jgi:hypothetical protein
MYGAAKISRLLGELTQTFARPGQEALVSILRTAAVLEHELNDALRPFELTSTQYNVLRILHGAGLAGLRGPRARRTADHARA